MVAAGCAEHAARTRGPLFIVEQVWGAVLLALAAVGCGGDDEGETVLLAEPPGVVASYGDPADTVLTPYPSNRYTSPADTPTGLRVVIPRSSPDMVNVDGLEETVHELEQMDGFSTTGGVIVTFSGPVDVATIALLPDEEPTEAAPLRDASSYTLPSSPFLLVDDDDNSDEQGTAFGLVPTWWEQAQDGYYPVDEFTMVAMPAVPLRPATRYLFVVTDALGARDGGGVHRSALTSELLSGTATDEYASELRAGLDVLEHSLGVGSERIVLATTFTTASVHTGMIALSELARSAPPPELLEPWTVDEPVGADGRVRFRGTFAAPEYRLPPPDGRFELDGDGKPLVQEVLGLEVLLAVSDAHTAAPRTVVIYGHGLAGDKGGCWGTADRLGELNAAVFAIDSPHHGSRADPDDSELDAVFGFFGVDDSDPHNPTFVIGRARDNFRQMASDQLHLVELINSLATLDILPPGAPDGVPDLDTSRILYIGHSFGAVQGPSIFALAPEITHAVWNVGGAGLMMLLRDSNVFSLIVSGLQPQDVPTPDGALGRFMTIAQAIVDPGDPLNYARFAQQEPLPSVPGWSPREVLLQEVVDDSIVPNSTSRALARAAGLPLVDGLDPVSGLESVAGPVTANLASGVTGGMSQFDLINGDEIAAHGDLIFSPEGRAQYLEFFQTGLAGEHATIPSPY